MITSDDRWASSGGSCRFLIGTTHLVQAVQAGVRLKAIDHLLSPRKLQLFTACLFGEGIYIGEALRVHDMTQRMTVHACTCRLTTHLHLLCPLLKAGE